MQIYIPFSACIASKALAVEDLGAIPHGNEAVDEALRLGAVLLENGNETVQEEFLRLFNDPQVMSGWYFPAGRTGTSRKPGQRRLGGRCTKHVYAGVGVYVYAGARNM